MRKLIDEEPGALVLPAVVLCPEVDHLLGARLGQPAQLGLYEDIVAGVYLIVDLDVSRYGRVLGLNEHYTALRLGFVDAAVAAPSEQLGLSGLATVDRRHFAAIHRDVPLELLPDEQ